MAAPVSVTSNSAVRRRIGRLGGVGDISIGGLTVLPRAAPKLNITTLALGGVLLVAVVMMGIIKR